MTTAQAIKHFGSVQALADAIGITRQGVNKWQRSPPVPRQCQLELVTGGKLKADRYT